MHTLPHGACSIYPFLSTSQYKTTTTTTTSAVAVAAATLYTVEKDLWYPHLDYAPGSIYSRQPNSMKHQQELLLLCV